MPMPAVDLPFVTDGGLETDLIFNRGVELPEFAAFPLVREDAGRSLLTGYYDGYAEIARGAGAGLMLEAPTWRANPDWGDLLGYSDADLAAANEAAIALLHRLRERYAATIPRIAVGGMIGPRGDGYRPGAGTHPDDAAAYHTPQVEAFARAGADLVTAYTLIDVAEAVGVVRAARAAGLPVAISFTVETDGRLPGGTPLAEAISAVDAAAAPDYFLVNCAHPTHIAPGLAEPARPDSGPAERGPAERGPAERGSAERGSAERGPAEPGAWRARIEGVRANASTRSHAELDEATELDEGDPVLFAGAHQRLWPMLPALRIAGGCCGTDSRHVAALWDR
jgi:S-methylmethionine-dependent homocysteine/selenocysteine methylase